MKGDSNIRLYNELRCSKDVNSHYYSNKNHRLYLVTDDAIYVTEEYSRKQYTIGKLQDRNCCYKSITEMDDGLVAVVCNEFCIHIFDIKITDDDGLIYKVIDEINDPDFIKEDQSYKTTITANERLPFIYEFFKSRVLMFSVTKTVVNKDQLGSAQKQNLIYFYKHKRKQNKWVKIDNIKLFNQDAEQDLNGEIESHLDFLKVEKIFGNEGNASFIIGNGKETVYYEFYKKNKYYFLANLKIENAAIYRGYYVGSGGLLILYGDKAVNFYSLKDKRVIKTIDLMNPDYNFGQSDVIGKRNFVILNYDKDGHFLLDLYDLRVDNDNISLSIKDSLKWEFSLYSLHSQKVSKISDRLFILCGFPLEVSRIYEVYDN